MKIARHARFLSTVATSVCAALSLRQVPGRLLASPTAAALALGAATAIGMASGGPAFPTDSIARELKADRIAVEPGLPPTCRGQTWPHYSEGCVAALTEKQNRQRTRTIAFARVEASGYTAFVRVSPNAAMASRGPVRIITDRAAALVAPGGMSGMKVALRALP